MAAKTETVVAKFTRKNGQEATLVEGTGRTLEQASRLVDGDQNRLGMAIASLLVRVDGQGLIYDDFLDWPLPDVIKATNLASEQLGNEASPAVKTS